MGELRGLPPPGISAFQAHGMPALWKPEQSLSAYHDNVYLYRSVLTVAMEVAGVEFKLKKASKSGKDDEIEYVESHQALETLWRPQPIKGGKSMLTYMDLLLVLTMRLMLNGEEFWVLDKRLPTKYGRAPTEIQPALPQYMDTVLSLKGEIVEYVYRLPERELRFEPMDVVHFKLPNPMNLYRGQSPVQPIRNSLDAYRRADEMNASRYKNSAVPAGTLETQQTNVSDEQRKKIMDSWRQQYGGPENSGKVAMLPNGYTYKSIQQTNQDLQFVESKNLTRDEILTAYGVGLEIFGKTESQTRANAEASIFVFQRFGVLPFVRKIADTLNNDYLPAFSGTEGLEFCFDDPVPANMEEKRLNVETAFKLGAATPNEVRKQMGLEPLDLPGMDVPYLDMGKVAVDAVGLLPEDVPPEDVEDEEPEEEPKESPPKGNDQTNDTNDK